ncbi:hypothetical protein BaRGS_00012833 [Batillaria attramentaria]|uniref:Uncharacterized protein n=1 Tax=Batillaria attramentaria TaxID=370345 RepID=A0ABD0L9A3_9CAEN
MDLPQETFDRLVKQAETLGLTHTGDAVLNYIQQAIDRQGLSPSRFSPSTDNRASIQCPPAPIGNSTVSQGASSTGQHHPLKRFGSVRHQPRGRTPVPSGVYRNCGGTGQFSALRQLPIRQTPVKLCRHRLM